jgi:hypothetical protein
MGREQTVTYCDGSIVAYAYDIGYDAQGRRSSITDARGKVTSLAYHTTGESVAVPAGRVPAG